MNRLGIKERAKILSCLVEGNSIRATCRMTGAAKGTVLKLLADVGKACSDYQDKTLINLNCKRIQCDEVWAFVGCKERNVPKNQKGYGLGDIWTWTAIDADTKLMVSYVVGRRDADCAEKFIVDLKSRLASRVQLTTDGYKMYLRAVEKEFAGEIDYAMLHKVYGAPQGSQNERRYSTGECCGTIKGTVSGNPDQAHISTSFVERSNLTLRMCQRRFTRLTNAFSKKAENLEHAVSLHFMYYNFARIHKTLRVTPAMEAGICDHVWSLEEIAGLVDENKSN
jgi:IS1 family transposase